MSDVKHCDRDGGFFIERAPNSIVIQQAYIYDENGKPQPFSGDFCPRCGSDMLELRKGLKMLPPVPETQDREG